MYTEHQEPAWIHLLFCKKPQRSDTIWMYAGRKIRHTTKWKLGESEGMGLVVIISTIFVGDFNWGVVFPYVTAAPSRSGRGPHQGPHSCCSGRQGVVRIGPPGMAGGLCGSAVRVPNSPKGVTHVCKQVRDESEGLGLGLVGIFGSFSQTCPADKPVSLSGENWTGAGRSWMDSHRETGKSPFFTESGGVGNT